jgi:hypothetical protein
VLENIKKDNWGWENGRRHGSYRGIEEVNEMNLRECSRGFDPYVRLVQFANLSQ